MIKIVIKILRITSNTCVERVSMLLKADIRCEYNIHIASLIRCRSVSQNQYGRNGGKCGVCGDPWQGPYENEAGGKYGNGIIVRNYKQGSKVEITIHISANHRGFFELKLCPNNNPTVRINHDCLNKYPLTILNGNGTRFYPGTSVGNHVLDVLLPPDVTCTQCVIQWRYHAGRYFRHLSNN